MDESAIVMASNEENGDTNAIAYRVPRKTKIFHSPLLIPFFALNSCDYPLLTRKEILPRDIRPSSHDFIK